MECSSKKVGMLDDEDMEMEGMFARKGNGSDSEDELEDGEWNKDQESKLETKTGWIDSKGGSDSWNEKYASGNETRIRKEDGWVKVDEKAKIACVDWFKNEGCLGNVYEEGSCSSAGLEERKASGKERRSSMVEDWNLEQVQDQDFLKR